MNIQAMMQQAKKLQAELERKQAELATQSFEASSGGGMVTVTVNGKMVVLSVKIDPTIANDVEMLQDLVTAATNEAITKAQTAAQGILGGMMGNLPAGLI